MFLFQLTLPKENLLCVNEDILELFNFNNVNHLFHSYTYFFFYNSKNVAT